MIALRLHVRPIRDVASFRAWLRASEFGLVGLAVLTGVLSGLVAVVMGGLARGLHVQLFGPESAHGLSVLRGATPLVLLTMPLLGGILLGAFNLALSRWWPRQPVDPIEANALYGGKLSFRDGLVVAVQNIVSNGFGASVGLEAGYTQAASGVSSWLGQRLGLRRGDLRLLVGCGAAGAIAAAFDAPLTGAFYAFELVIGTYAIASLAPVVASAVTATLVARALSGGTYVVVPGGVAPPGLEGYVLSLLLGLACALAGIALMRGVTFTEATMRRFLRWAPLRPVLGGLVVGLLALVSPIALSAGHGALHLTFATESTGFDIIWLALLKSLAVVISLGAGFRGGLFFASLLLGALVGKVFAAGVDLVLPGMDPLLLSLVGMSAFGSAVVGAPLAMTFLALETTGNFVVAGSVLAAVTVAGLVTRRLFGYSFATWRFHLRGETIRSAHDIGWLRELSVGKLMRRDLRTVRSDTRLASFKRDFPLGSTARVVAVDEKDQYAGLISVPEAYAAAPEVETVEPLLQFRDRALLPAMNAKEAMAVFDTVETEALAVVDGVGSRKVLGLLTASHLLRRYGEEVERRRREETGLMA
ncbi:Chloride channel protein [Roseomonas mucosa]|jgi:chloride channel protein, CIC family|uniref:Chloride channel protein n=1 Tax=Roseomonas mucosa TaxID=207340 RepID=A0A1S8DCE8_9PROT|nr:MULTISPECIES: chloride channel protein [Roseomonas]MBS5901987.1 chloride channel protein [Acetobacteraceae bacterium]ATR23104.1 chloride channel protein [Roseomonas sp. FDAARGOS_362]MDT8288722.1 chloride channel protein [Roseomonas mucosa]MDT8313188.1 chloride channel protein [Roseomonas mucosa]MDT8348774.1 chloride channel protein [Roseomonas mucosa]